jgi:hypothetical protein
MINTVVVRSKGNLNSAIFKPQFDLILTVIQKDTFYKETVMKKLLNVVLFFLAPFIGLAYVFAIPVVITGAILHVIGKAVFSRVAAETAMPTMARIDNRVV